MTLEFLLLWIFLTITTTVVHATSKLIVIHSPPSIQFESALGVNHDMLKEIYCVALGLSTDQTSSVSDVVLVNPFDTPEAVVELHIEGATDIFSTYEDLKIFLLPGDENKADTFEYVTNRIKRLSTTDNILVNMQLSKENSVKNYTNIFGEHLAENIQQSLTKNFNPEHPYDGASNIFRELVTLKAIIKAIKRDVIKPDQKVDFIRFIFDSLRGLGSAPDVMEVKELFDKSIKELSAEIIRVYEGNVLITMVMFDENRKLKSEH